MERAFFADDVVVNLSDDSKLGVVDRTHADLDTHIPFPQSQEDEPIRRDKAIKKTDFRKFLRDGVPPKGTVLVRWQNTTDAELIPTTSLRLLDRSLLIGDVVKKSSQQAMSGVVINTFTKCRLQPIYDVTYKGKQTIKGLLPVSPVPAEFDRPTQHPPVLEDIQSVELEEADTPAANDLIIYKDWIGRLVTVMSKIALLLSDNCVVEIDDNQAEHVDESPDAFCLGDVAVTKKGTIRTGEWIYGKYNPNTAPVGTVVRVRPYGVEAVWLRRRVGSNNEMPPELLDDDEFESRHFTVYDRTRRPKSASQVYDAQSTVSNSEIDIVLGMRVRFKDLPGACAKYDGSTAHGRLNRIDRSTTMGYDLNLFDVERFETDVTVQWQDLSMTTEHSYDLVPDHSIEDEHAAWPGEIVHSLDLTEVPGMTFAEQPSKVGVVQSVNASDRVARVRWSPRASIRYQKRSLDDGEVQGLLSGVVGVADGASEEVSLYDIEAPAALNVRRGDIVFIVNKQWETRPDTPQPSGIDWLGEVVDTRLDGTLTVRLGAADEVQDFEFRREEVDVAVRSDETMVDDGGDVIGDDYSDGEAMDLSEDEDGWQYGGEDDDMSGDSEPQATYEDENGIPLDEDDVEGDEWESEDEEMMDAPEHQTPPTSDSATPQRTNTLADRMSLEGKEPTETPTDKSQAPQYLILDSPVPHSHHYAAELAPNNPTQLKRIQKEHRILQKPSAIPSSVYVRTWESRLDLLRVIFIGPSETPYANAPFVLDFFLPPQFPTDPPQVFFHSWSGESGLGGVGRANPNLYEDGKVCLSLLGTWESSKGESWNPARSTVLQVIVSLLGLVLVREPYFNEAGYEHLAGLEDYKRPSALYNERIYLRTKTFILHALGLAGRSGNDFGAVDGLVEVVRWQYLDPEGPKLLQKVIADVAQVLQKSDGTAAESDGLNVMSKGACIPLRRVLDKLKQFQSGH